MEHHELGVSLIREFLAARGCTNTLALFDARVAGSSESCKSRSQLAKDLGIGKVYRANKARPTPLPSNLDALAAYYFKKDCDQAGGGPAAPHPPARSPSASEAGREAPGTATRPAGGQEASSGAREAAASAEAPAAKAFKFTAPDGTGFDDRRKYRQYMFKTYYTFENREGETLVKSPGEIDGQAFNLDGLRNCTVVLADHSDQVQVDGLVNCRVFIGPSCESVFLRDCTDCRFTVACKQLRTRGCTDCQVALYTKTDPIVETTTRMEFRPFNGAYAGLDAHFRSAGLDPGKNHWQRVFDFSDEDEGVPQPHFTVVTEPLPEWAPEARVSAAAPASLARWFDSLLLPMRAPQLPGVAGDAANPVSASASVPVEDRPEQSGGATADGALMAFSFKHSQADAERAIRAAQEEAARAASAEAGLTPGSSNGGRR